MRPSSISTRRRARVATTWSWVMMMIVVPAAFSSSSRPRIAAPVAESRFPVGSSASTTGGAPATARAIATRCRSPPDSWPGRRAARCASPTRSRARSASRRRPPRRTPAYSSPSATLPSTLCCSARWNCWNTNPIRAARTAASSRSAIRATSRPVTRTVPVLGVSSVPIRCSSVDLPDPDGPTIAVSSPAITDRLTSSSARTGGCPGYTFDTRSSCSTGTPAGPSPRARIVPTAVTTPRPRAARA